MKHTKKRVAALLLALAMVLSLMPMAFAADEYPEDMPAETDASYAAVKSAYDNGIMTGENGKMNLEGTILRSTVSKMVVTAFAAKGEADLSGYPDVDSEAWYAAWMAKANQMGIMTGSSGKMNPGNEVTLAEVATMLVRALGLSVDKDAAIEGVDSWAAPYIKALLDAGYISSEDVVGAHQPMSRVAFAEVIYKISGQGNYANEENAEITEDQDGNIVITANGVSLKGITVTGDVIIADGVDAGTVTLDNVKVEGRVVVRGAGVKMANGATAESTVVAATAGETSVTTDAASNAGDVTVVGTNGKAADKVTVDAPASNVAVSSTANEVEIGDAKQVITADGVKTTITGTVDDVVVPDGAKPEITNNGTIKNVTSNEDVAISGTGSVENKTGAGTVTDGYGNEVGGSDEPVDIVVPDLGGITIPPSVKAPSEAPAEAPEVSDADKVAGIPTNETKPVGSTLTGSGDGAVLTTATGLTGAAAENHDAHDWGDPVVTAPTCTTVGTSVKTCKTEGCGATETTYSQATGHTASAEQADWTIVPGNCQGAGYASKPCGNEGCTVKNVEVVHGKTLTEGGASTPASIDQQEHTAGTAYATRVVEGIQKHFTKCSACSQEFGDGEACAAADPTYTYTATGHSTTCDTCGATMTAEHTLTALALDAAHAAPTCTASGYVAGSGSDETLAGSTQCATCGYKNWVTAPALGHQWVDDESNDNNVPAGPTTPGLKWQHCGRDGCDATQSVRTDPTGANAGGGSEEPEEHTHTWQNGVCTTQPDGTTCVCDNSRTHATLHKDQTCDPCGFAGQVEHTFSNGLCTGCGATCTADTCPNKANHVIQTEPEANQKCPQCGTAITNDLNA